MESVASHDGALSHVLERYWGYTSFRPLQREAMAAILSGRDSTVVLPTKPNDFLTRTPDGCAYLRWSIASKKSRYGVANHGPQIDVGRTMTHPSSPASMVTRFSELPSRPPDPSGCSTATVTSPGSCLSPRIGPSPRMSSNETRRSIHNLRCAIAATPRQSECAGELGRRSRNRNRARPNRPGQSRTSLPRRSRACSG